MCREGRLISVDGGNVYIWGGVMGYVYEIKYLQNISPMFYQNI